MRYLIFALLLVACGKQPQPSPQGDWVVDRGEAQTVVSFKSTGKAVYYECHPKTQCNYTFTTSWKVEESKLTQCNDGHPELGCASEHFEAGLDKLKIGSVEYTKFNDLPANAPTE